MPEPNPMLLVLNIHPSRRVDLLTDQLLTFDRPIKARDYNDGFGNACTRLVAPAGLTTISTEFVIYDSGEPISSPKTRSSTTLRICRMTFSCSCSAAVIATPTISQDFAWTHLFNARSGWRTRSGDLRLRAPPYRLRLHKCRCVEHRLRRILDESGVCRDFAHLAITLCRCMNIPARYCTGYLGDIAFRSTPNQMDFSAWFEVYLGGAGRRSIPAITSRELGDSDGEGVTPPTWRFDEFGPSLLARFEVVTEEVLTT